jgi:hypothetical protein
MAVLAHYVFEAPAAVRSYAEEQMNSAVREEVKSAASEQMPAMPPRPTSPIREKQGLLR